ncbi:hypothetical protein C21_03830 [Arenibacter sp. NBRC 103722]|uniref:DUF4138 domain-containing protein n=1 Tax=Arenibacter sp. NBRC 103722 TaxID=1113929 RepID=UPI000852B21A|nr:DUF4138 domain-containing protein [Arenibacter sp. NBRC 103722]GBF21644.1 hypothetical protein C21_03830 [Arenibacter sp. NBRC 103722]
MKKNIFLFGLLATISSGKAQITKAIDTIFANEQLTVSLFFPDPIRQGVTGSSNYAFSFNRERAQYFGLLQATPGDESNLLVVTQDGGVYSYLLRYSQKLEKLNYFIDNSGSIGHERTGATTLPHQKMSTVDLDTIPNSDKALDYPKLCAQLLRNPRPFDQIKYKDGLTISMTKSIYYANDVYVVFEIENGSQIDFEINTLNLYKVNGNNKRKSSYQELLLSPIFQFQIPTVVPKGEQVQFVGVYPKFTLGAHEKLLVKLEELNGSRDVVVQQR